MKIFRKLASGLLLVLLFGYPAMACLIPDAEMTDTERECCKHMAHQCGSMDMPSSHPCCQKDISRPHSMLRASFTQLIAPALCGTVVAELPQLQIAAPDVSCFDFHPPPESPPGSSSILRI